MKSLKSMSLIAAAGLALLSATNANAVVVDLELALLVDVSGSVNASEYNLQKQGYVNAFKDSVIQSNIASLGNGIAVTYIEWSGSSQQAKLVDWSYINDAASADSFANAIAATSRVFGGSTAPGSAINYVTPQFTSNSFDGSRWVIDVSGDGRRNSGSNTAAARDAALAAGVDTINGLPILGESGLEPWYNTNIKGGTNAFVFAANGFSDFERAVKQKIGREIKPVPTPATLALMGLGLIGMVTSLRRKKVN